MLKKKYPFLSRVTWHQDIVIATEMKLDQQAEAMQPWRRRSLCQVELWQAEAMLAEAGRRYE